MLDVSRAIGSATAGSYFKNHYASATGEYYSSGHSLEGQWRGKLAAEFGLSGTVRGEAFQRLVDGQDPRTGEQLIQHRQDYLTREGKKRAHRAAYDLVFAPPKSNSLAALVGGDHRIIEAHDRAVVTALSELERFVQAQGGGGKPNITTGKLLAATFRHDSARPERGSPDEELVSAPQLHTHTVVFAFTVADKARSLEAGEVYRAQAVAKATYQAEMKHALRGLGYEVEEGKNGAGEIAGFTPEYLASESLRSAKIRGKMQEAELSGARAAEQVAHEGRAAKLDITPEAMRALHLERAAKYGNQPQAVVAAALAKTPQVQAEVSAQEAVTFAKRSLSERLAVIDDFSVIAEALRFGQGHVRVDAVKANLAQRIGPEFVVVSHGRPNVPGLQFSTRELIAAERDVLQMTREGKYQLDPLVSVEVTPEVIRKQYQHLHGGRGVNDSQAAAASVLLRSPDRITGLQGVAGSAKTSTVLRIVTDYAQAAGMQIVGLAPTGRARKELQAAGIQAQTLQRFLMRADEKTEQPRLFIVDESSLVSTKQYRELLKRLGSADRIVEVGDIFQHSSIETARIFDEQQKAGMRTAHLNKIVRQTTPEMVAAVEKLRDGKAVEAIRDLTAQNRVSVVEKRTPRMNLIAERFAASPEGTIVIDPSNESRRELNGLIRDKLQGLGKLRPDFAVVRTLVARQDINRESRKLAASYGEGAVVQFQGESKALGVASKEYVTVITRDTQKNTVTAETAKGRRFTFNPKQHYGVEIYETRALNLAEGESIVFRKALNEHGIATGDRATIQKLDRVGNVELVLEEKGRKLQINLRHLPHLDYSYATTSYSIQGATADRVLIHADTGARGARQLLTAEMGYVGVSRSRTTVEVVTNDPEQLAKLLSRNEVKRTALAPKQVAAYGIGV